MAVSKSLRFQVFRRDGHICQYCGGQPPDVALVVDHVVPAALGGSDDPTNLTTSCRDCNAGKSATPPDAPTVAAVGERERIYREAMAIQARNASDERSGPAWFTNQWDLWTFGFRRDPSPLPSNWNTTVAVWLDRGLTEDDIGYAITIAMEKSNVHRDDKFRYMAGVCWRMLTQREEIAAEAVRVIEQQEVDPWQSSSTPSED